MADQPHPTAQAVIDLAADAPVPPTSGLSVESARDRLDRLFATQTAESVATVEDYSITGPDSRDGPLPVRVYEPEAESPYPVLCYFHGGGFVVGGLDTHDTVCAALTNRADCLTISVDYRLAPEHPFPAGLEDCYAALEWAARFAPAVNGDPDRLAIAGDSAGGSLAAGLALLARDLEGPALCYQGLIYPGTAPPPLFEFDSYVENAAGYLLEMDSVEWYYDRYLQSDVHRRNEYAWPLLADDLSDLPPATVLTAGFDPIRDEGIAYAEALADDGVDVTHRHYDDMIHGFLNLTDAIPASETALDELGTDLQAAFG